MFLRSLHPPRALALAVVVASLAIYAPSVGYGFALDDYPVVVENRLIRSAATIPALVSSPEWSGIDHVMYRPITDLTYALNHAVSGLSPWSYHAANVLLHAIAAVLLLAVGLRLGLDPTAAGAAALLFAIHPIHVEAVANVVGRKDILPTVFALAAVLLHRRALLRGGTSLAWPALALAAAMLSKESGVVGVGVVLLHDLSQPRPDGAPVPPRRRAALYASYAVALAGYLLLRSAVTAGLGKPTTFTDNVTAHVGAVARVSTAIAMIGKGLALQFLPRGQSPDWSYPAISLVTSPADPRLVAAAMAIVAWLALGVALRRRVPMILVGLAWYLGTLLPASNLLFPTGVIFGERLLYLPSAGLALALGAGASAVAARARRIPIRLASLAAAIALGGATLSYSHAWGDELRLFRLAAANAPGSSRAHMILSFLLLERGEAALALEEAERAIALNPWVQGAHWARAQALRALGRLDEESQAARAALAAPAGGPVGMRIRPPDEGKLRAFRAVRGASPASADELNLLAGLARDAGQYEEAEALWRRAIAADPRHAAALRDFARYETFLGHEDRALTLCLFAVDADVTSTGAWYTLGKLYLARGDTARSLDAFRRVLENAGAADAAELKEARRMVAGAER